MANLYCAKSHLEFLLIISPSPPPPPPPPLPSPSFFFLFTLFVFRSRKSKKVFMMTPVPQSDVHLFKQWKMERKRPTAQFITSPGCIYPHFAKGNQNIPIIAHCYFIWKSHFLITPVWGLPRPHFTILKSRKMLIVDLQVYQKCQSAVFGL